MGMPVENRGVPGAAARSGEQAAARARAITRLEATRRIGFLGWSGDERPGPRDGVSATLRPPLRKRSVTKQRLVRQVTKTVRAARGLCERRVRQLRYASGRRVFRARRQDGI